MKVVCNNIGIWYLILKILVVREMVDLEYNYWGLFIVENGYSLEMYVGNYWFNEIFERGFEENEMF